MDVKKFISTEGNDLKVGDIIKGKVKSIQPYGAFIEIGDNKVGALFIENISIARIKTPWERFSIGDSIDVVVKNIDEKGRIELSHKELLGTWEDNVKDFEEGTVTKGIIRQTEKNNNGIFIELKPNLVGMAEYTENVEYGQNVDVYIKKIIKDKKKIKLIIK